VEVLRPHGVVVAREGQQPAVLAAVRGRQALRVPRRDEGVLRAVSCNPAAMPLMKMDLVLIEKQVQLSEFQLYTMTKPYLGCYI